MKRAKLKPFKTCAEARRIHFQVRRFEDLLRLFPKKYFQHKYGADSCATFTDKTGDRITFYYRAIDKTALQVY